MAYGYTFTPPDANFEGLSDVSSKFQYSRSLKTALRAFFDNSPDKLGDNTALITGVPKHIVLFEDDGDKYSPIPYHRKALYLEDSKTLLVTHRGLAHCVADGEFFTQLCFRLDDMHCWERAIPTGGATVPMANVIIEPDESLRPGARRPPSFVELTSVSDSNQALHRDARIWLENPESEVTQVVTIDIRRTKPEIVYSLWKKTPVERETRQHPHGAEIDHEVRVKTVQGRTVADGDLTISFEKLFRWKPRRASGKGDIILSSHNLEYIARVVWREMGFISWEEYNRP